MKYSRNQIKVIRDNKPELGLVQVPSLDEVIVEFLQRFEVYVQPITSNTINRGEVAVAGAITGMDGSRFWRRCFYDLWTEKTNCCNRIDYL